MCDGGLTDVGEKDGAGALPDSLEPKWHEGREVFLVKHGGAGEDNKDDNDDLSDETI